MMNSWLSDVFFNWSPAERAYRADDYDGLVAAATDFLSGSPFAGTVSPDELAMDFWLRA